LLPFGLGLTHTMQQNTPSHATQIDRKREWRVDPRQVLIYSLWRVWAKDIRGIQAQQLPTTHTLLSDHLWEPG